MEPLRRQYLIRHYHNIMHDNEKINLYQNALQPTTFKSYKDRLIACNGDCGSALSKFIDTIVHHKVCLLSSFEN